MTITSINPYTEACIEHFAAFDEPQIEQAMTAAERASSLWAETPLEQRTRLLVSLAERLRAQADELATLITTEMGKLRAEALAEIDKCAWVCDYYAEHAHQFLADEPIKTDAPLSLVAFQPLGVWLAIMPWNFPFWQVFRCAVPAIAAGNPVLLKHASNVCGCALAIERLFREAGAPAGLLQTLLIPGEQAEALVADPRIRGVSLTGSESAGRRVAAAAGARMRRSPQPGRYPFPSSRLAEDFAEWAKRGPLRGPVGDGEDRLSKSAGCSPPERTAGRAARNWHRGSDAGRRAPARSGRGPPDRA
ncbi:MULTISPECIES: aldehyde dehydrogenase family protein [Thiorhodovibrio]|uniref:aldehyde dehydrogenase family protein n=1 Tax=Thiorhodovibrio TaxID=61593 RepID=UPI001F5DD8A2|nr:MULTISPECIES: aldehyde dehydrogenase family protein [Thiorhodovibrio]WPL11478.1 Succinate-semialdehyde dehydrogenase [NADP(+)] 1 [Thiorhodovibrio litoralis]